DGLLLGWRNGHTGRGLHEPKREHHLRELLDVKLVGPIDLFPWLLIAVLMLLVLEGLVANRFYRRPKG
ncbi:MAG: hypothetical protein L0241_22365, partial [Planctomycetia bacterium]|nr:hypothetical protein [Planctomycetia bacterium]